MLAWAICNCGSVCILWCGQIKYSGWLWHNLTYLGPDTLCCRVEHVNDLDEARSGSLFLDFTCSEVKVVAKKSQTTRSKNKNTMLDCFETGAGGSSTQHIRFLDGKPWGRCFLRNKKFPIQQLSTPSLVDLPRSLRLDCPTAC